MTGTVVDAYTINALTDVLRGWQGALLAATHDGFFMKYVVEGESTKDEEDNDESDEDDGSEARPRGRVYRIHMGLINLYREACSSTSIWCRNSYSKPVSSNSSNCRIYFERCIAG